MQEKPTNNATEKLELETAAEVTEAGMNQGTPPPPLPPKTPGRWKKPLLVFAIILVAVMVAGAAIKFASNVFYSGMQEMLGFDPSWNGSSYDSYNEPLDEYITVVSVEGVISSSASDSLFADTTGYDHQFTLDAIDSSMTSSDNAGILLYVNSPGGGIYESDELYLKILQYQKTTDRPVYVYMASMAASGGYYISAPADRIYANRNCWTGSIGVTLGTFYDVSGLLENYGVETITITSGENKDMGSYTEPMTKEQLEIFQSLVDEAYAQFVDIVSQGRNLPRADVVKLADGRIYTATQAMDLGLVDGIYTFEDALYQMQAETGLQSAEIYYAVPPQSGLLEQLLGAVAEIREPSGDLSVLMELMDDDGQMPIAYICPTLE